MKLLIFDWHSEFGLFIAKISISLNCVLLIFFFRICRNEIKYNMSNTYLFPYFFCAKLIRTGLEEVHRWTKKKDVDMFRKDCIFIPIIQNSYFSSCVICNPGPMSNTNVCNKAEKGNWNNLLMYCISHFNSSYDYHISASIAKNIQK